MEQFLRVEFHCHTVFSKDSLTRPEKLLAICRRKGIDRVVITDHNTISGAMAAKAIDPVRVIVGEEILTREGELLAAFLQEEVPRGLPAKETVIRLRAQGAFISISHPFDRSRSGHWKLEDLTTIAPLVDAVESFNARCILPRYNQQAQRFAREHSLLETVGSDAHTAFEIGKATMEMPSFHDAASFRQTLLQARQQVSLSAPWVRLTSRYAVLRKRVGGVSA